MTDELLTSNTLLGRGDRVLAAVSGGVDSMVLLSLLVASADRVGLEKLSVAHCNFSLRGAESDRETELVKETCRNHGIDCFTITFDTKGECALTGESTQIAARRLRYRFFEDLCDEHGFSKIAIAHHANDSIETFFVNLTRGTGLRGLTGIGRSRGMIVRPLLGVSRDEIEKYALENNVAYLNDSSNASLDYLRNRLRHDIIPRINSSTPHFSTTMGRNLEHLTSAQRFIDQRIDDIKREVMDDHVLDLDRLRADASFAFILFEILHPYGFSPSVVEDIRHSSLSGKEFFAEHHTAWLDRGRLIIRPREQMEFLEREIDRHDPCVEWLTVDEIFSLETPSNVALLSADALQFPLTLRKWRAGDWFIPLGLKGQKKVSDCLIDGKVPLPDKEQQGVLVSGADTIVWLVGRRIDDRFRVCEQSKSVVRITL